jgi:hypothetical protein
MDCQSATITGWREIVSEADIACNLPEHAIADFVKAIGSQQVIASS